MDTAPHAPSEETPRTLPALLEGLDRQLSAEAKDINAIRAHVRGIESFTNVTSPVPQHEADAAMTSSNARRALADKRLTELGITTSQSNSVREAASR